MMVKSNNTYAAGVLAVFMPGEAPVPHKVKFKDERGTEHRFRVDRIDNTEKALAWVKYQCTVFFDEYPDQLQLRMLCRRIYRKVLDKEHAIGERDGIENKCWLFELVQVMTYHEIIRRRSEYRKYRRFL